MRHFDVCYRGHNILKRSFNHVQGIYLIKSLIFIIGLCKDLKYVLNRTPVSTSSIVLNSIKHNFEHLLLCRSWWIKKNRSEFTLSIYSPAHNIIMVYGFHWIAIWYVFDTDLAPQCIDLWDNSHNNPAALLYP